MSLFRLFRPLLNAAVRPAKAKRKNAPRHQRLWLELLEDRCVPTSIASTFNASAIPAGSTIWFSSVATSVTGVGTSPATIHVTNQTIAFSDTLNGVTTNYNLSLPNADLTLT